VGHHFEGHARLRRKICELLHMHRGLDEVELQEQADRIATFPSVSYGLAIAARNLHRLPGIASKTHIVTVDEEFPNDTYAFEREAVALGLVVLAVSATAAPPAAAEAEEAAAGATAPEPVPVQVEGLGRAWNDSLLASICAETALVVVPHVHWMYGVLFDLEAIAFKCRECGALLVVDGSQSVGAVPFDFDAVRPDALIVAAYKWMLGPYSIAYGYFGPFFDGGVPLEESWMNRTNSQQFSQLTRHEAAYRPLAQRYNMGEFSEFIHGPMLESACDFLISCGGVPAMHEYIRELTEVAVGQLRELGVQFVDDEFRAAHIMGAILPTGAPTGGAGLDAAQFATTLKERGVHLSVRGRVLRISVNVFNDQGDLGRLIAALQEAISQA